MCARVGRLGMVFRAERVEMSITRRKEVGEGRVKKDCDQQPRTYTG